MISELIDEAYRIGMQQVREEVESLAEFLRGLRPKHLMEIGSSQGGSFYLLCQLAGPGGVKISLDLPGAIYGGEYIADPAVLEHRNAQMVGWSDHVHILLGDSHLAHTEARVAALLTECRLDFLFIDGDHTYEGVRADYLMYSVYVRQDGYIVFHDIADTAFHQANNVGVARFWKELRGETRDHGKR